MRLLLAASLLCAGVVLVGCNRKSVNVIEPAEKRAEPHVIEDIRIERDRSLRRNTNIREVIEGRTTYDFLRVQVSVSNETSRQRDVRYRWEWFDADGFQVRTNLDNWRTVTFHGHEEKWIQGTAPSSTVVDFKLKLMEP